MNAQISRSDLRFLSILANVVAKEGGVANEQNLEIATWNTHTLGNNIRNHIVDEKCYILTSFRNKELQKSYINVTKGSEWFNIPSQTEHKGEPEKQSNYTMRQDDFVQHKD